MRRLIDSKGVDARRVQCIRATGADHVFEEGGPSLAATSTESQPGVRPRWRAWDNKVRLGHAESLRLGSEGRNRCMSPYSKEFSTRTCWPLSALPGRGVWALKSTACDAPTRVKQRSFLESVAQMVCFRRLLSVFRVCRTSCVGECACAAGMTKSLQLFHEPCQTDLAAGTAPRLAKTLVQTRQRRWLQWESVPESYFPGWSSGLRVSWLPRGARAANHLVDVGDRRGNRHMPPGKTCLQGSRPRLYARSHRARVAAMAILVSISNLNFTLQGWADDAPTEYAISGHEQTDDVGFCCCVRLPAGCQDRPRALLPLSTVMARTV